VRRRALFGAALAGLTACRRLSGTHIRLVTYQGSEAPYIARALGLFEKNGLSVELEELSGASRVMQALLAGSADVVLGTYDQALQASIRGQHVRSVLLVSECHCLGLVASPKSERKVTTLADLKGARVGVSAPGGPMQNFLTYLLRRDGIDPDSVGVAAVGIGPPALVALEYGKVDAAVVFYSTLLELRKREGGAAVLAETFTREGAKKVFGRDSFPSTCLLARSEWLAANGDAARRLVRAFRSAVGWLKTADLGNVRSMLPSTGHSPDEAIDRATLELLVPMLSTDGRMTRESAELAYRLLVQARPELRETPINVEDTFTNEWL